MSFSPKKALRLSILTLGVSLLMAGGRWAAAAPEDEAPPKPTSPEYRFDFSVFGGAHFFTKQHSLGNADLESDFGVPYSWADSSPKHGGLFGGRLGLHFNKWIGLEAEVAGTPTKTRNSDLSKMWIFAYRGSIIVHLSDNYMFQPFLLAGYGGLTSLVNDETYVSSTTNGFLHGGLGFKIGFADWIGLRVDGRILAPWTAMSPVIPRSGRPECKGPDFEASAGLYINFGEVERVHYYSKIISGPPDRDHDGVPDATDKCPDAAEDRDGFQDDDGCPDPDNDADGIPDLRDRCPNDAEDKDGFQDDDGCPDLDNDGDGVADAKDKCPTEAEDRDGFQDDDGCPDPDNDKDGLPDLKDKCPNEAETINNYQDEDGCPDEVPMAVKKFTGVIEGINFRTGSAEILSGSYVLLDRAVSVLKEYSDVNLEISGHTDNRGKPDYNRDLSQRRADAVKNYFIGHGVTPARLQSIGYGQDRPIGDNHSAAGRSRNRRTEFRLITTGER